MRRLALGLTVTVISYRAYFPGEDADKGTGLVAVLLTLLTAIVASAGIWLSGKTVLRLSKADLAVLILAFLVALSTASAADRRPAITLAWEWGGLAVGYFLLRNLPRGRRETAAVAGTLLLTATAVSLYALVQVGVELPAIRTRYLADPESMLRAAGIGPESRKAYEQRLLFSSEAYATFALGNSLAGFVVMPLVLGFGVLFDRLAHLKGKLPRASTIFLAGIPLLLMLVCLILTKSRSGFLGLVAGLILLGWRWRGVLSARSRWIAALVIVAAIGALLIAGASIGHLDKQVLTESSKSLRYRLEYWAGTWRIITENSGNFLGGVGPGNFAGPYLRHKLPEASEEISDPHNLLLEVWVTAGLFALLALVAALRSALHDMLAPSGTDDSPEEDARSTIYIWFSGALGWILMFDFFGLNPFGSLNLFDESDLFRLLALSFGWTVGALTLIPIWRRGPVPADAFAAGALAAIVNLFAAGGIGFPPVAMMLWAALALGQNARTDRPCGRLRAVGGRFGAFGLAAVLVGLLGAFLGANVPFWQSQALMEEARRVMSGTAPSLDRARSLNLAAARADAYSPLPWMTLAEMEFQDWLAQGSPPSKTIWRRIDNDLKAAVSPPRNPSNLQVQRFRMNILRELLRRNATGGSTTGLARLRNEYINATARAVDLYPTNASLRADLAQACSADDRFAEAAQQAREALRLDALTPHLDKKLAKPVRERLNAELPRWDAGKGSSPPKLPEGVELPPELRHDSKKK
jgi:O-antigen ligase